MTRRSSKPRANGPRRSTLRVPRVDAEDSVRTQIEKGKLLLELQIKNQEELDRARSEKKKWSDYNEELLRRMVDTEDLVEDYYPGVGLIALRRVPFNAQVIGFRSDVRNLITRLESILGRLELIPEPPEPARSAKLQQATGVTLSDRVFVVHGRDEETRESVARFIEKLGLRAIILDEQPNEGRTIIEKFEDHGDVGFAVVLLTPDDVGASKDECSNLQPRARQNVILELGFFIGRLGRKQVCALLKGGIEIPSDFSGVLWVPLDPNGAWRFALAKEMKAAGLGMDLNKLV